MMIKIYSLSFIFFLFALTIIPFFISNPERKILNEVTRKNLPGSFITLSDGVTHYEIQGPKNSDVVVLIHGFSQPSYVWDNNYHELIKNGFRVLRYDLYGRGLSDRPSANYDISLYTRQLAELLDALHIQKPINIAGVSMGGTIAAQFTVDFPKRVKSTTLFDPTGLSKKIFWQRYFSKIPFVSDYIMRIYGMSLLKPDGSDFVNPDKFTDWQDKFTLQTKYQGFRYAILATLRNFNFLNMKTTFLQLGKTNKPILLFWGEGDKIIPLTTSNEFLKLLPNTEFHMVPNSGHISNYEGAQFVNHHWTHFLKIHEDVTVGLSEIGS